MSPTHREVFGSRCIGTGRSSFVLVQIPPGFSLSHLLEEISTYFLKINAAFMRLSGFAGPDTSFYFGGNFSFIDFLLNKNN